MAEQTQLVEMPDGNQIEFPSSMPDVEIAKHVQRYIGQTGAASPITAPSIRSIQSPINKLKMHESYLSGDENDDPATVDSGTSLLESLKGAGQSIYSTTTPNIVHQLVKKVKGQPHDLVSPVENAIGMMAGEEGLISGGADNIAANVATRARTAAPSAAASGLERSFPASSSRAGAAAGAPTNVSAGASTGDIASSAVKLISPRLGHAADLISKLVKRIRGGGAETEGASPTAASPGTGENGGASIGGGSRVAAPLAPHQSTAVPQTFAPTGRYSVSGSPPIDNTHEWQGANSPVKSVEEPADLSSTVPHTISVKPILQRATINNGPGTSDIPGANGGMSSTRPEPAAIQKLVKSSSTPKYPLRNKAQAAKLQKVGDAATGTIDDAAIAATTKKEAKVEQPPPVAAKKLRKRGQ